MTTTTTNSEWNQARFDELLGRAVVDFGAAWHASLALLGSKLGLYKELAASGRVSPAVLAERTGTAERYVLEWLRAQAAGGYVSYDPDADLYYLSPEQAFLLADENSPAFIVPGFEAPVYAARSLPAVIDAFRTGNGVAWGEHDPGFFCAVERFFRPAYVAHLTTEWIPAIEGIEQRLREGIHVADIGCGHGASTILMAEAYPQSAFTGIDAHPHSIETARKRSQAAGLNGRARFEVATAKNYNSKPYEFVTTFDALHDMGDPVGAARHVLSTLTADGVWMIVEPKAGDRPEENFHPVGRAYYGASTMVCTPGSLAQEVGLALGAQAGESRLRDVVMAGGFTRFRRAAQTPFHMVFEARR